MIRYFMVTYVLRERIYFKVFKGKKALNDWTLRKATTPNGFNFSVQEIDKKRYLKGGLSMSITTYENLKQGVEK